MYRAKKTLDYNVAVKYYLSRNSPSDNRVNVDKHNYARKHVSKHMFQASIVMKYTYNVASKWSVFMFRIREFSASFLSLEANCKDWRVV